LRAEELYELAIMERETNQSRAWQRFYVFSPGQFVPLQTLLTRSSFQGNRDPKTVKQFPVPDAKRAA